MLLFLIVEIVLILPEPGLGLVAVSFLRCFFSCWNLGEDASLPITSGGSYQVLVNNVFYFTQRVVDKLWQGMFNKESKLLIDFIIQLIAQVIHCLIGCSVRVFLLKNVA